VKKQAAFVQCENTRKNQNSPNNRRESNSSKKPKQFSTLAKSKHSLPSFDNTPIAVFK